MRVSRTITSSEQKRFEDENWIVFKKDNLLFVFPFLTAAILTLASYLLLRSIMFFLDAWLAISLVSDPTWRHHLSLFGSFAIGVASGIYHFWDAVQVNQKQKLRESDLKTALANRVIEEEFFKILNGTVFKEPEHHMRIWALQIEDGRHFVWYDYNSYQRRDSRGWVKPCSDLQILSLPNTDFEISEFSGDQIQARRAKTLTIEPRDWPADGTFLIASKEALFETFCPRK